MDLAAYGALALMVIGLGAVGYAKFRSTQFDALAKSARMSFQPTALGFIGPGRNAQEGIARCHLERMGQ